MVRVGNTFGDRRGGLLEVRENTHLGGGRGYIVASSLYIKAKEREREREYQF